MQLEVIDKHGNVRRLRPGESLADGERLHVPYAFYGRKCTRRSRRACCQARPAHSPRRRRRTFDPTPGVRSWVSKR